MIAKNCSKKLTTTSNSSNPFYQRIQCLWCILLIVGFGFFAFTACADKTTKPAKTPPLTDAVPTPPAAPVPPIPVIPSPNPTSPPNSRIDFKNIQSWTYQLNSYTNTNLSEITKSNFQLAVVDYSSDGSESGKWTSTAISAAKEKRWMIAYLSVGEAEDYRAYWQSNWKPGTPSWVGQVNPRWAGNYPVEYWNAQWQAIILDYLDQIIMQGFDGAYLDLVDAYQAFNDISAKQKMIDWVCMISKHAKAKNPAFKIIPQNASELIHEPGYAACVDATGNEETWFTATDNATSISSRQSQLLDYVKWKQESKLVLLVDYANSATNIAFAYAESKRNSYIEYVTDVDLNVMRINTGFDLPN